ncbi:transposase [Heyndrickxia coagulans]|nr:transposase [Heyndrickxia coagulans]
MIKAHDNGIIQWFWSKINNSLLEGINSVFQAAKRIPARTKILLP